MMHPSFKDADQELLYRLRQGCVLKPKRWSGDTHEGAGDTDEEATDRLLVLAAQRIESLLGVLQTEMMAYRAGYRKGYDDSARCLEPRIALD